MDDDEISCKLVPHGYWRRSPSNYHIWYIAINTMSGFWEAARGKNDNYYIVFDPALYPTGATLEEQMQLEEIKWLMGE